MLKGNAKTQEICTAPCESIKGCILSDALEKLSNSLAIFENSYENLGTQLRPVLMDQPQSPCTDEGPMETAGLSAELIKQLMSINDRITTLNNNLNYTMERLVL